MVLGSLLTTILPAHSPCSRLLYRHIHARIGRARSQCLPAYRRHIWPQPPARQCISHISPSKRLPSHVRDMYSNRPTRHGAIKHRTTKLNSIAQQSRNLRITHPAPPHYLPLLTWNFGRSLKSTTRHFSSLFPHVSKRLTTPP